MSKEKIGYIILKATSGGPPTPVYPDEVKLLAEEVLRLAEENNLLQSQLATATPHAKAFTQLRECCGYVQNSSEQVVRIGQDDATRTFLMTCGVKKYHGASLAEVIAAAYEKEKQE